MSIVKDVNVNGKTASDTNNLLDYLTDGLKTDGGKYVAGLGFVTDNYFDEFQAEVKKRAEKAKEYFNNGDDLDATLIAVQGGVGAEYFILPNLSVLTEMGLRYVSANPDADGFDTVSDFGIFADWLPQAGVRFYF